jgi:hypothetical protein
MAVRAASKMVQCDAQSSYIGNWRADGTAANGQQDMLEKVKARAPGNCAPRMHPEWIAARTHSEYKAVDPEICVEPDPLSIDLQER